MDDLNEMPDKLARTVRALDADAARAAARVDPERMAQRVLKGLRDAPAADVRPGRGRRWLRIAAALLLFVAGGIALDRLWLRPVPDQADRPYGPPDSAQLARTDLPVRLADSVLVAHPQAVLNAVESVQVSDTVSVRTVLSIEDLNETELQTLLQSMTSSEGES